MIRFLEEGTTEGEAASVLISEEEEQVRKVKIFTKVREEKLFSDVLTLT